MHVLVGSGPQPHSQLLNTSPEGEEESSPESCALFQFLSVLFFGVMNVCSHVFLQRTAQSLCWCDAFLHSVVSGATGVPWKREAGFSC